MMSIRAKARPLAKSIPRNLKSKFYHVGNRNSDLY